PSPRCLLRPRGGSTLFPYTTLFRSLNPGRPLGEKVRALVDAALAAAPLFSEPEPLVQLMTPAFVWLLEEGQIRGDLPRAEAVIEDRKSTRLNSSHVKISYAVFCLKK